MALSQEPKRRHYNSARRQEQASAQRRRILEVARRRFLESGYASTTLAAVAADAQVSVETIYKAFRNKPGLLKAVFDFSVAGDDEPVPMIERNFADRMRSEPDPRVKLEIFAEHMSQSMPRAAPVYLLARDAAASEAEIAKLLKGWRDDQLAGLESLARGLNTEGLLRPGLAPEKARDLLWTINSTEVYELLVLERGWSREEYRGYLAGSMIGALLTPSEQQRS
ncbi:MAG TPA: TetR/AcrR family transcriptional regulator [Actinomycetota bacterium]|nr:TetR/AcrR family transcriptional regulator [Actinomycetota bacterium]